MRIVCSLFLVMVLVMVIAAMGGCSISASSGSISDSILPMISGVGNPKRTGLVYGESDGPV